ncbi:uncharacterized protein [Dermacentor albipictus]|uniref:uncharacterized protein isoform X1 n=2 Tax=Dermacentor albipictus TaxID=60249 RepID=UPI0038FC4B0C
MTKFTGQCFISALLLTCSAISRGSRCEEPRCQSSCHLKTLRDFFDDLQDSANTKDVSDLMNFARHFCKAKYTERSPCEAYEDVKEREPGSSWEFKHLYPAVRQFVCHGELQTWKVIKRMFTGGNENDCLRAFAAVRKWPLPGAALCNEMTRSSRNCSTDDKVEREVLALTATVTRVLNCTARVGEHFPHAQPARQVASKHQRTTCQYRKAVNCLTDFMIIYTSKVATIAKKKQELQQKIIDEICQRPAGICASTHSTDDCSSQQRNVVKRFEDAMSASVAEVCREDASLLKNMSRTLHCFDLLKLNDCLNPNGMFSAVAIFSTRHTPEMCRVIENKVTHCLDRALPSPDECGEHPDVDGVRNLFRLFLANVDCSKQSRSDTARPLPGSRLFVFVAAAVVLLRRL